MGFFELLGYLSTLSYVQWTLASIGVSAVLFLLMWDFRP